MAPVSGGAEMVAVVEVVEVVGTWQLRASKGAGTSMPLLLV